MSVGKICVRSVVVAAPDESVLEGARRMRDADVGCLVVLDAQDRTAGLVTDRDVMARCVAERRDPAVTPLSEIMSDPTASVRESSPIEDALVQMARQRVRRLPVVDEDDRLIGILALDDVLDLLAEETATIGRILSKQRP